MRRWFFTGGLIGAAVAAWLGCSVRASNPRGHAHQQTPCDKAPHDNTIEVTSAGVSCKDVSIRKNVNSIVWYSADGTKLKVIFPDNPFDDLSCIDNECTAYWVNREINSDQTFKYFTFLGGKPTGDPNVIIKPNL